MDTIKEPTKWEDVANLLYKQHLHFKEFGLLNDNMKNIYYPYKKFYKTLLKKSLPFKLDKQFNIYEDLLYILQHAYTNIKEKEVFIFLTRGSCEK